MLFSRQKLCINDPMLRFSAAGVFVTALLLAIFHFGFLSPLQDVDRQLSIKLRQAEQEYAYQRALSDQYETTRQHRDALTELLERAQRPFSSVAFARALDGIVKATHIHLVSETYSAPKTRGDYISVEVKMRVLANYEALRHFLAAMSDCGFYVILTAKELISRDGRITA